MYKEASMVPPLKGGQPQYDITAFSMTTNELQMCCKEFCIIVSNKVFILCKHILIWILGYFFFIFLNDFLMFYIKK